MGAIKSVPVYDGNTFIGQLGPGGRLDWVRKPGVVRVLLNHIWPGDGDGYDILEDVLKPGQHKSYHLSLGFGVGFIITPSSPLAQKAEIAHQKEESLGRSFQIRSHTLTNAVHLGSREEALGGSAPSYTVTADFELLLLDWHVTVEPHHNGLTFTEDSIVLLLADGREVAPMGTRYGDTDCFVDQMGRQTVGNGGDYGLCWLFRVERNSLTDAKVRCFHQEVPLD